MNSPRKIIPPRNAALTAQEERVVEAYLRLGRNRQAVAAELGLKPDRVSFVIGEAKKKGAKL